MHETGAYLRLHAGPPLVHGTGSDLLFIDADLVGGHDGRVERFLDPLRATPAGLLPFVRTVLVRWDDTVFGPATDNALAAVASQLRYHSHVERLCAVTFRMGQLPELLWWGEPHAHPEELLARARATEVEALIEWGHGIWEPSTYHYRLPSGEHCSTFVRVADGIRRPRDAAVLATWLYQFAESRTAVILDSATLVPVVLAFQHAATVAGIQLGPVALLDEYPSTQFELQRAVREAGSGNVLALLSVTSTGDLQRRVQHALQQDRAGVSWRLEVVLDKQAEAWGKVPLTREDGTGTGYAWLGLNDRQGISYRDADDCKICRADQERSPVVQIDPRSFEAMVLPEPTYIMPSLDDALRNAPMWQLYDQPTDDRPGVGCDGVGVQMRPPDDTRRRRPNPPVLGVGFDPHALIDEPEFSGHAFTALSAETRTAARGPSDPRVDERGDTKVLNGFDAVVIIERDHTPAFQTFLRQMADTYNGTFTEQTTLILPSEPPADGDSDATGVLADKSKVLIVAAGSVSGGSMQELNVRVHDIMVRHGRQDYTLVGFVVHARPTTRRELETLRNAYNRNFVTVWLTYLPWRSVHDEELAVLPKALPGAQDDAFSATRRRYCAPASNTDPERWDERLRDYEPGTSAPNPRSVFWGMPLTGPRDTTTRLRPTSLYGLRLAPVTVLAAVGSAIHRSRIFATSSGAPSWVKIEMPALAASYFDPLIIMAVLRWAEPHEIWWGPRAIDAELTVTTLWDRDTDPTEPDRKMLLPELLLAAAQGKVARAGVETIQIFAKEVQGRTNAAHRWSAEALTPVSVGLELLRRSQPTV